MAVAYESIASTSHTAASSTTITKPTGLAVGDGMIAGILVDFEADSLTPPSGWITEYNADYTDGTTSITYAVFSKTADSADVAATDFTFTATGAGVNRISGFIIRASDYGGINVKNAVSPAATAPGSVTVASGITPTVGSTVNLFITFAGESGGVSTSFTSQAIATDNPTWTERATTYLGGYGWEVATAPRTQSTAWGNASYTYTANASGASVAVFLVLQTRVNGSHTVVTAPTYVVNQPFLRNGGITTDGDDPDTLGISKTSWQNESKPTTNWTNEPL